MNKNGTSNRIIILLTSFFLSTALLSVRIDKNKSDHVQKRIDYYTQELDEDDDFQITAHRGFSSLEVENTRDSYTLANTKPYVDYIEMDARMTKDGELVLSHNDNVVTCDDTVTYLSEKNYLDIISDEFKYYSPIGKYSIFPSEERSFINRRRFDLNSRRYKIIGLLEGLNCCGDKKVLLDLKFDNNYEEFTKELKEELKDVDTSDIIFQSLDPEGIKYLKEHSDYTCSVLIDSEEDLEYLDQFDNVGIRYNMLTSELIDKLFEEKDNIFVWTVNSEKTFNKASEKLGEHYKDVVYITDFPDLIETKLLMKEKGK